MIEHPSGLLEKADAAFREAMADVLKRAGDSGTPIIIWKDDRVTQLPARNWNSASVRTCPRRWALDQPKDSLAPSRSFARLPSRVF
jgi:hypothetical protein